MFKNLDQKEAAIWLFAKFEYKSTQRFEHKATVCILNVLQTPPNQDTEKHKEFAVQLLTLTKNQLTKSLQHVYHNIYFAQKDDVSKGILTQFDFKLFLLGIYKHEIYKTQRNFKSYQKNNFKLKFILNCNIYFPSCKSKKT